MNHIFATSLISVRKISAGAHLKCVLTSKPTQIHAWDEIGAKLMSFKLCTDKLIFKKGSRIIPPVRTYANMAVWDAAWQQTIRSKSFLCDTDGVRRKSLKLSVIHQFLSILLRSAAIESFNWTENGLLKLQISETLE